jgi:hypothetical protein
MMKLYHGSIFEFAAIDVNRGKPYKDFGIGFYASHSAEHAERLARRNRQIEQERLATRRLGGGADVAAWLYTFELNPEDLATLNVKTFDTADREWVDFIVLNRTRPGRAHGYDVVSGPTANDDTNAAIQLLLAGAYGEPGSPETVATFLRLILPERLPFQMFFGTARAASLLRMTSRRAAT